MTTQDCLAMALKTARLFAVDLGCYRPDSSCHKRPVDEGCPRCTALANIKRAEVALGIQEGK